MKRRTKGGAQRMMETGKVPVQCWFTLDQREQLRQAAKMCGIPMATFRRRRPGRDRGGKPNA